jgi:hypothetical protein
VGTDESANWGSRRSGNALIQLEKQRRPDFDETQKVLVLVRDDDLYVAFAPYGNAVGHPLNTSGCGTPSGVQTLIWSPCARVRTERDADVCSSKLVSQLDD